MEKKELQLQPRLQCLADLVPQGARLADVGTDHGYLPVWLLQRGRMESAIASDINALPLDHARATAAEYGVTACIDFRLCPGLAKIGSEECDTVAIAGMGGETIIGILEAAPWTRDGTHTLILQPQSAGQALRLWLAENGFQTQRETLVKDGGYLYSVLLARWNGERRTLCPGAQFVSPQLLSDAGPLLPEYFSRIESALRATVDGLRGAEHPRPERLAYHETALREITEMRKAYAERT